MSYGKKQFSQKTREPYGKVTEVGQVPVALQEISELVRDARSYMVTNRTEADRLLSQLATLTDSLIPVTCANPGCLSQMAEDQKPGYAQIVERIFNRIPQSRFSMITGIVFESKHVAVRFNWMDKTFRWDGGRFPEEVTEHGFERSSDAQDLDNYLLPEVQS